MDWYQIFNTFAEGVIVLDSSNRIQKFNQSAASFFNTASPEAALNEPIASVLEEWLAIEPLLLSEGQATATFSPDHAKLIYEVIVRPIGEDEKHGRVVKICDITKQYEIKEALNVAQKQANAALQIKSNFLDVMSHELRTPLNAVVGYINILRNTPLNAEQIGLVNAILTNGDKLSGIITNLLEYAEAEADHYELLVKPFSLDHMLRSVCEPYESVLQEKSVSLTWDIEESTPASFIGDPLRMQQILHYLLDNASKYTEEGTIAIAVSANKMSDDAYLLRVAVEDTGVGIPVEKKDKIFQTFSQLDNTLTRKFGGLGLSLAIAKKISEHMGGSLEFESEIGTGSTFVLTIPLKRSHIQPAQNDSEDSLALKNKKILLVGKNAEQRRAISRDVKLAGMKPYVASSTTEALYWVKKDVFDVICMESNLYQSDITFYEKVRALPQHTTVPLVLVGKDKNKLPHTCPFTAFLNAPFTPTAVYDILIRAIRNAQSSQTVVEEDPSLSHMAGHHPLSILLVEDNAINQKLTERMLQRLGYHIDLASNGQIAYEIVQNKRYDVVLMDIQMPVMDGVEATRKIRRLENAIQQPHIIAVTAHARKGDRERYLAAGMNDYISKPIQMDRLVQSLYACNLEESSIQRPNAQSQFETRSGINLNRLKILFGDDIDTFLVEMGPTFLEDSEHLMMQIKTAVQTVDSPLLKSSAHTLRGASASMGMEALAKLSHHLEKNHSRIEEKTVQTTWVALQEEHKQIVEELTARLTPVTGVKT